MSDTPKSLGEQIKALAEDMADAACATEAGSFVDRQRQPLHAAIDRLVSLASTTPPVPMTEEQINDLVSVSEVFQYHPGAINSFVRDIEQFHGIKAKGHPNSD